MSNRIQPKIVDEKAYLAIKTQIMHVLALNHHFARQSQDRSLYTSAASTRNLFKSCFVVCSSSVPKCCKIGFVQVNIYTGVQCVLMTILQNQIKISCQIKATEGVCWTCDLVLALNTLLCSNGFPQR